MSIEQKVTDHEYPLHSLTTDPAFGTVLFVAGYEHQGRSHAVPFPYEDMKLVESAPQTLAKIRVRTTEIELSGFMRVLALGTKRSISTVYTLTLPQDSEMLERVRKADEEYAILQMQRQLLLVAATS